MWILFPPEDRDYLYPTRIPYEESSVFSDVNIENPDLTKHPLYSKARPYSIVLDKGDILYVPQHWWHFVKSIDDEDGLASISVNMWLPLEDDLNHLSEAIVHLLCTALFPSYKPDHEDWLLDSSNFFTPKEAINYVKLMTQKHGSTKHTRKIDHFPSNVTIVQPRSPICSLSAKHSRQAKKDSNALCKLLTPKAIINCILKPNVISMIAQNLHNYIQK